MPEDNETIEASKVTLKMREPFGEDVTLRPFLTLGVKPLILMEIEENKEGGVDVHIDSTGPSNKDELAAFLASIAEFIKEADAVPAEAEESGE